MFLLLAGPSPAIGEDRAVFVISSGREGGYYEHVAQSITSLLAQQRIAAEHRRSGGSLDNLEALGDAGSPVNLALSQADALSFYLREHPEFAGQIEIVDDVGRECAVLITRRNGGIESAADLKKPGQAPLAIDSPQSGAAVTFGYMTFMEPAFRNTRVVERDLLQAMLDMRRMGADSDISATMLMKRPRFTSPALEAVIEQPDVFKIAPVREKDVNHSKLPDGSVVYTFEKVKTGFGSDATVEYETMCTRGLLLLSRVKVSRGQRQLIEKLMLEHGRLIAPGSR
jgi:hypothetical protein